jgi:hypothetical protein
MRASTAAPWDAARRDGDRRRQAIIDDLRAPIATTEEDRIRLAELGRVRREWRHFSFLRHSSAAISVSIAWCKMFLLWLEA